MLSDPELEVLLHDLESDRVERKESAADPGRIRQAICAFGNDMPNHRKPGVVLVGVRDNGACAGFPITDALLLTLSDMRSDGNILPFPVMTVQKKTIGGCELAVIEVEPSAAPPLRYNGRVWIRVGPRRATATAEEERRLNEKRRFKDRPYDLHVVEAATLADLDLPYFTGAYLPAALPREVLEANERSLEEKLASLRFVGVEAPHHPTVAGLLVLGKTPVDFIPGAYLDSATFHTGQEWAPVK